MNRVIGTFILAFALSSCEKEETPISLPPSGDVERVEINLQKDYSEEHYFDFETGRVLATNEKTAWDLRMSCSDWTISLNSAKAMKVAIVENTPLEVAELPEDPVWYYDHHQGLADSMAIGPNWSPNATYFIDKGYDPEGNLIGICKVSFERIDDNYFVKYAQVSPAPSEVKTIKVEKDPNFQNAHLSLDSVASVEFLEPPRGEWELYLGQYTFLFIEPEFTPYLVSGILLNSEYAEIYVDTSRSFNDISYETAEALDLTNKRDAIGYDWKSFSFETGNYTIDTETNYIIKTREGYYYKMHMVDFYTSTGEKGNIVFEYQRL
jgi:hypothetical protein